MMFFGWSVEVGGKPVTFIRGKLLGLWKFPACHDNYWQRGAIARLLRNGFGDLADVESVDNTSENCVFTVKVRRSIVANEEWATVRIWTCVRHRKNASMRVGNPYLLICELWSIDTLSLNTFIMCNNFATLHHKSRYNPLEDACAIMHVEA